MTRSCILTYGVFGARFVMGVAEVVFGARSATSSNSFASGSNQNCGNCITDRPTTRVHAAPGGKSSFSLGWE